MVDYLMDFNSDRIREPQTLREAKIADAAQFSETYNYNFSEGDGEIIYNRRTLDKDGKGWISRRTISCELLDRMTILELISFLDTDPKEMLR